MTNGIATTESDLCEEVFSFPSHCNMRVEVLMAEILNGDELMITDLWCEMVRDLLQKQLETLKRADWINVSVRFVDLLEDQVKAQKSHVRFHRSS
jgi:hypothetical protein